MLTPARCVMKNVFNNVKDKAVKIVLGTVLLGALVSSCARGITPEGAANGKAKCGRHIR